MTAHDWFILGSWVVLAVGLVAATWFAVSWGRRIHRPWSFAAFDAGGWVFALLIVYAYQAYVYAVFGIPEPSHTGLWVARLAVGALLDTVIVARLVAWLRLRADFRRQSSLMRSRRRSLE